MVIIPRWSHIVLIPAYGCISRLSHLSMVSISSGKASRHPIPLPLDPSLHIDHNRTTPNLHTSNDAP
jgi:hypothetical protein